MSTPATNTPGPLPPFANNLARIGMILIKVWIVWWVLFILNIIIYHSTGRSQSHLDIGTGIFTALYGLIWFLAVVIVFLSNFVYRRLFIAAFVSAVFHGALMVFPLVQLAVLGAMLPGSQPGEGRVVK